MAPFGKTKVSGHAEQDPALTPPPSASSSAYSQDTVTSPRHSKESSSFPASGQETGATSPNPSVRDESPSKLVTPAGFRLEPENEGWHSDGFALVELPKLSRASSLGRCTSKRGLTTFLAVPALKEAPDYDHVTELMGLKLYRVSTALPYLLGTSTVVDRIQVILENNGLSSKTTYDTAGPSAEEPQSYSDRDRALMVILSALKVPEWQRREARDWTAQGLASQDDALILYKDVSPRLAEVVHLRLGRFIDLVEAWLLSPNPANLSCDPPNVKNTWEEIAARLRQNNVDVAKIDMHLYRELTMDTEPSALTRKLHQVSKWYQDGTLDRRYLAWKHEEAHAHVLRQEEMAKDLRDHGLYSKRYTRTHPLGIPREDIAVVDAETAAHAADEKKMKEKVALFEERRKHHKNKVWFGVCMGLVFGALLGCMLWAMATKRWDFTQVGDVRDV
ncbi:hypothetical protein EJ02DRAFT_466167 [Clathrospora elynae]|uniref:Uncharacterized protein n=1 Tax=Clathrospora elynae TaxID=706981 RepID=A0A6A5SR39_9PLEO|nr:hypothetical protein EJ02DRAFT_466167 [Clathrospora elynae]